MAGSKAWMRRRLPARLERRRTPGLERLEERALLASPNSIVLENANPGSSPSEWSITTPSPTIQGFATDISVNHGNTINFKISTDATAYHIDIYRMGYYGGMGARRVTTILPLRSRSAAITSPAIEWKRSSSASGVRSRSADSIRSHLK